jgi:hypothetical protein
MRREHFVPMLLQALADGPARQDPATFATNRTS